MSYDLQAMQAPRLVGTGLRVFTALLESGLTRPLLAPRLLRDLGVLRFRGLELNEPAAVRPELPFRGEVPPQEAPAPDLEALVAEAPALPGAAPETVADFARAYREGVSDPEQVVERLLAALERFEAGDPPLRAFVAQDRDDLRAQARASAARWREGRVLGPLDGVPVAVKDQLDVAGYPTGVGTSFLGREPATADATVVARLRAAGALILGKTNMHELGIGVTGLNPHHGTPRNPHDLSRHSGGSSSGSAAAVAAGLCPLALGADGGGSIRTPAALCGLVGLKATFGRLSLHGGYPLAWSVGDVGPLAASVRDAALSYALMAGPCPHDRDTRAQPPVHLTGLGDGDLAGIRLGVFRPWFEDAAPEVVQVCQAALDRLAARGAELRDVELPGLEAGRVAHLVSITSEVALALEEIDRHHRREFGLDVRINIALGRLFNSRDYVRAQRARTHFADRLREVLGQVDLLATPMTGATAPAIAADALPHGESDLQTIGALLRFAFPANLSGYPALSVPAGYGEHGLPIGLQLLGRPWEEHLLLRVGEAVERDVERRAPRLGTRLLTPEPHAAEAGAT